MANKLSGRERIFAIGTVAAAMLALLYVFVCEPLYSKWKGLDADIDKKRNILVQSERVLEARDRIERRYAAYEDFLAAQKLSDEEVDAVMLGVMDSLASQSSVAITNVKPLGAKDEGQYKKFTIRVSAESSMVNLMKFVYDLQSSKQLLKVERMTLRAKARKSDIIQATLHVTKINILPQ